LLIKKMLFEEGQRGDFKFKSQWKNKKCRGKFSEGIYLYFKLQPGSKIE